MLTTATQSDSMSISNPAGTVSHPWLMLISRSVLFILSQGLIALILMVAGTQSAWEEAGRYWTIMAFLANIASLYLLIRVFRSEGKRFWDILRF